MFSRSSDKRWGRSPCRIRPNLCVSIRSLFNFYEILLSAPVLHLLRCTNFIVRFKHSCCHQNLINVGKKSHLGSFVLKLRGQIWQICAWIWNPGEWIALTHTCFIPAVPSCGNHFPEELPVASLPVPGCVCVIYSSFPVCPECLILLDRWLDDLQSPQDLPDDFCFQQPLPCLFLVPDYCLAFLASTGPSVSTQKPNLLNHWIAGGSVVFYSFCVIVKSIVFILESEHSMPCFYPR